MAGALALCVTVAVAGCEPGPIEWRDEASPVQGADRGDETSAPADMRLTVRADGSVGLEPVVEVPTSPAAADTAACVASVRTAASTSREVYGVWWSRRENGRAWLVAARSDDAGATWTAPVPVDTVDRGSSSCGRPAPAIAADSASRYVHVTYFLTGPDGPGVFFSHSMDRGALFHAAVPIMYGERPAATAVAAADSIVVVAFEDPNRQRSQIEVAVSRTWGHIFLRNRLEASGETLAAGQPLIALRDSLVAVGWYAPTGGVMARTAVLRPGSR